LWIDVISCLNWSVKVVVRKNQGIKILSVSIPIFRSWDCLLADKVVIPLRSVEGQWFRVSNGGILCLGVGDVADDWSSLVLAPRIGLVGQGVIVHDVPRVGDT
jgi:hypothetical protein